MRRRVIAAVDDMFFASKIRATAGSLDVDVKFVRTIEQLLATKEKPDLILVDLQASKIDPLALSQIVKTNEELKSVPLLGFFSHVETELRQAALMAGYDQVMPRSVFSRDLAVILSG